MHATDMPTQSDAQLLAHYAQAHSEEAFAQLVERHLGLVYSAALRQVRSPELAEEISQTVFIDLAHSAQKLPASTILPAWLYQVARRAAIDVVRRENRRHLREKTAHELLAMNSTSADWTEIEPLLEEAMQSLDEDDRAAVLLRYFANKSLREVGDALGASENAAQKRLARALDRLNEFFTYRGVRISGGSLALAISANAVQAVPTGLTTTIAAVAATQTATATAAATFLTMSAIKNTAIAVTLVAAISTGIYQANKASSLEAQVSQLKTQPQSPDLARLQAERDEALAGLAGLQAETQRLNQNLSELMRLRDEVSRLKREAQAAALAADPPSEAAAKSWLTRLNRLKTRLQEMPEAQTPEMQLLTHEDWLAAVKGPELETETDYREAFAALRNTAQSKLAAALQPALVKYLKQNNAAFPRDLAELLPYTDPPFSDATLLSRYAILPADDVSNVKVGGQWAITQKAPVDSEFDNRIVIGPDGYGSASYPRKDQLTDAEIETLKPAMKAFADANNGQQPAAPELLEPYLQTPEQKAAFAKFLKSRQTQQSASAQR